MEAANRWYQFNLYWKKIIIFCTLLCFFSGVKAQVLRGNLINYDNRPVHYGFHLGINHSKFRVKHPQYFLEQNEVDAVYGVGSTAFSLGFVFNFRVGEYFDFRTLPTVSFYQRTLQYELSAQETPVLVVFSSSFIELPLLMKYKSYRRGNYRMYMIGGAKPGISVGSKKEEADKIGANGFDVSIDVGFGLDIYYPLFKFAPELRFSMGLMNLLGPSAEENIYNQTISQLNAYTVTLYLHFE
ncbi:MAG: PorT family protein [Cytophagales bacterium]|nr:PorT family protein [Cytophagales bacterium]